MRFSRAHTSFHRCGTWKFKYSSEKFKVNCCRRHQLRFDSTFPNALHQMQKYCDRSLISRAASLDCAKTYTLHPFETRWILNSVLYLTFVKRNLGVFETFRSVYIREGTWICSTPCRIAWSIAAKNVKDRASSAQKAAYITFILITFTRNNSNKHEMRFSYSLCGAR